MNKVIRTFFFFSKRERIGVTVLLVFLFAFILAPSIYSFFKTEESADFTAFDQAIALLEENKAASINNLEKKKNSQNTNSPLENAKLFAFDPNTISKDSLLLLGIPPKTVNIIANYRNKGGKFYKAESLKKMYTLSPSLYEQLQPFITINSQNKSNSIFPNNKNKVEDTPVEIKLSMFDPNQASLEELQQLGLSKKTSTTLIKFRNKGGKFHKKEDLKKIYGLSENKYQQLENYINIPENSSPPSTGKQIAKNNIPTSYGNSSERIKTTEENVKKIVKIDINKATPEEWQSLYGIGPAYAKRITNFRAKLGGFSNIKQVAETYGIPDSTFQKIKPSLLSSPIFRKIPLNTCDSKALSDHPYIRYQLANTIIAYRKQHGPFKDVENLLEIGSLDEKVFKKIKPYLSLE